MVEFLKSLQLGSANKHEWVRFCNPRNKRVRVTACINCGIARGPTSSGVECERLDEGSHNMRKMGWEQVSEN